MLIATSCKKESENIFNMFTDVSVTFHGDDPLSVTDYKLVNDGDVVYIDYTITSAKEDMYYIVVEKSEGSRTEPQRTSTSITDETKRREYSGRVTLTMLRDGKTSYRIYPMNKKNYYMGDGGKSVTIEVRPSYIHYPNRRLYTPDTATRVAPCYFSIQRGEVFSYTSGKENSADIDFGLYRTWTINTTTNTVEYRYNIYALNVTPNPLGVYDISTWQKKATLFKSPASGGLTIFNTTLVSAKSIETAAKAGSAINLKQTTTNLASGNLIYFLTAEGKYGAIYINSLTKDLEEKPYLDISVKVQK